MGREHLFTPADLLAANAGAPDLLAAVNLAGSGTGGWPTIDRLRGHFVLVVHGEHEVEEYATAANAVDRLCFVMRESLAAQDATVRQNPHVVFHGEVDDGRGPRAAPGPVHQQFYVLRTHSEDIWDDRDSCSFAVSHSFPPAGSGRGSVEDVWSAMVGCPSNTTVDDWGKCFLMAREDLEPDSRYFAAGRAADEHGLIVQWRDRRGGDTLQTQLGDYPYRVDGQDSHVDRENVPWVRLVIREEGLNQMRFIAYGSVDGRQWRRIEERVMQGDFALRGIAACSQGSLQSGSPGTEFHFHHLRRNGHLPVSSAPKPSAPQSSPRCCCTESRRGTPPSPCRSSAVCRTRWSCAPSNAADRWRCAAPTR